MEKTDTLPKSDSKTSLRDLFTRGTSERAPADHPRRRAEDKVQQGSGVILEPVSRKPYDLSYACLLIPRFSSHYLIGNLAEHLREWMRQICLSFAWRLEEISIYPEYMQWVLFVPPATPATRCIRTIREQTSRLIFQEFGEIREENLSNDFWAPGYLVTPGPLPHSPNVIHNHIRLIRQQQGVQPRLRR